MISDTHGLLRSEAERCLAGVDHIIHAGDIGGPDIVSRLRAIAPTTAIRGNVDTHDWAGLPDSASITLGGRLVFVLHDIAELNLDPVAGGYAIVIAGHSHRPRIETIDGVLFLNPGSAGPRRFKLPVTLAIVDLGGDIIQPSILELVK